MPLPGVTRPAAATAIVPPSVPEPPSTPATDIVPVEARLFPSIRFNEETTKGGRDALGWYHERRDEARGIGLGPEHDFASHAADAFGMIAIYKATTMESQGTWDKPLRRNLKGVL